jgi:ABC-type Zn uptake system ZnuABC Zn-binding protein ZnuA
MYWRLQFSEEKGIQVHTTLVQPSGAQLAYIAKLIADEKVSSVHPPSSWPNCFPPELHQVLRIT